MYQTFSQSIYILPNSIHRPEPEIDSPKFVLTNHPPFISLSFPEYVPAVSHPIYLLRESRDLPSSQRLDSEAE